MFARLKEIRLASMGGRMGGALDWNESARQLILMEASESEWLDLTNRIERQYGLVVYPDYCSAADDWFRYVRQKVKFEPISP